MTPGNTRRRRRKVRSFVVRAVVFLLLGAVVNVAVAWGIAGLVFDPSDDGLSARKAIAYDSEGWIIEYIDVSRFSGPATVGYATSRVRTQGINRPYVEDTPDPDDFIPSWSRPNRSLDALPTDQSIDTQVAIARGWPALALMCKVDPPTEHKEAFRRYGAIWLLDRSETGEPVLLPLQPIWRGFVINTLFYAAILWMLFAFPFALRRWRRVRRGLCAKCAYPVGASDVCTECGAAVARVG